MNHGLLVRCGERARFGEPVVVKYTVVSSKLEAEGDSWRTDLAATHDACACCVISFAISNVH